MSKFPKNFFYGVLLHLISAKVLEKGMGKGPNI